jgi:hypothetical protein
MILDEKGNMVLHYEDGNLRVAYEPVGKPFEKQMQRVEAMKYLLESASQIRDAMLLRTAVAYTALEKMASQPTE